jgi:hypothetical protein
MGSAGAWRSNDKDSRHLRCGGRSLFARRRFVLAHPSGRNDGLSAEVDQLDWADGMVEEARAEAGEFFYGVGGEAAEIGRVGGVSGVSGVSGVGVWSKA